MDKSLYRIEDVAAEAEAVQFAAHMSDYYSHGLPAWITKLYVAYLASLEHAPRTVDVEKILELTAEVKRLKEETSTDTWRTLYKELRGYKTWVETAQSIVGIREQVDSLVRKVDTEGFQTELDSAEQEIETLRDRLAELTRQDRQHAVEAMRMAGELHGWKAGFQYAEQLAGMSTVATDPSSCFPLHERIVDLISHKLTGTLTS